MKKPHVIRKCLLNIIDKMMKYPVPFVKNPGKDFTRTRKITFADVILIIMSFTSHTTNGELKDYFLSFNKSVPYQSAFNQQRAKINDSAFPHILKEFNRMFPLKKKLNGFHVSALDGSDVNMPADKNDCKSFIPYNSKNGGYFQCHVNALYDLLEERYIDIVIQARGMFNEIEAAIEMVKRNTISGPFLYICDRGYFSFNLIATIIENKQCFLIRLRNVKSLTSPFKRFTVPDTDEFDVDLDFKLIRSTKKIYRENPDSYKIISSKTLFDYFDSDDREATYHFTGLRLIKIILSDGTVEYLLTNLPREKFALSDMKDLYWMRWGIEKSFLFLKYGIALNYFHSIKREYINQEIYAKIILYNYITLILSTIEIPEPKRALKHKYKISFRDSIDYCKRFLLSNLSWKRTQEEILKHKTVIRQGRNSKRIVSSQKLRSLNHRS